jgi:GAF domain
MLRGELGNVVPDARASEMVKGLPVTTSANIGAYVGVPVHPWDGLLFGTLCCLSHSADPLLDDRDARVLQVLAAVIGDQVGYTWFPEAF